MPYCERCFIANILNLKVKHLGTKNTFVTGRFSLLADALLRGSSVVLKKVKDVNVASVLLSYYSFTWRNLEVKGRLNLALLYFRRFNISIALFSGALL